MDYGDTIVFIFAAINGAGIGNRTEYIYHRNQFSKYFMVALNKTIDSTVIIVLHTKFNYTELSIVA